MNSGSRLDEIISEAFARYENAGMAVLSREELMQKQIDLYNESTGNLNEFDGYNCNVCKNKGFIARLDENGYEVHR